MTSTSTDVCRAPIRALAPWLGGKRSMAERIVAELGDHEVFIEPFMGGCAVLFSKPRAPIEIINDLHDDVVNLARIVADADLGRELQQQVRFTMLAERELARATERLRAGDYSANTSGAIERAADFLVASWMTRNGFGGTDAECNGSIAVRWSGVGGNPATRWRGVQRSIAHWRARLSGVTILSRDAFEVLSDVRDVQGVSIYVDPPYPDAGQQYRHAFDDTGFMGAAPSDHERLCDALSRFEHARVVLSYYEHPKIRELYPESDGWVWVDCRKHKATAHTSSAAAESPEMLIINGPSYTAGAAT